MSLSGGYQLKMETGIVSYQPGAMPRGSMIRAASCVALSSLMWLLAAPAAAQGVGTDAPSTPTPSATPSASLDVAPLIFAPDIFSVPSAGEISQSLNTPSGASPFLGSRAVARGLQLNISQIFRFDDNARRLVNGVSAPPGRSRGDMFSVTNFGASYGRQVGLQTFFVRGDFGLTRYRENTDLDNNRYSFAAGVNWRIQSTCSGSLTASTSQSEIPFEDLAFGSTTSLSKTDSIDIKGRCRIYERFYGTFGASASQFSVSANPINDAHRLSVRGGIEYAVPRFYTLGIETIYSTNDFVNRVSTALNPLTTELTQREHRAYYSYTVSPKTVINVAGGVIETVSSSLFGSASRTAPTFSGSVNWRATPKIFVSLSGQVAVAPPQALEADFQRSKVATLSVIYRYSPKLSMSAIYARTRQTQSLFSPALGVSTSRPTEINTYSLESNYRASPFLSAGLGYRFTEQTDNFNGQKITSNLYTLSLTYRR